MKQDHIRNFAIIAHIDHGKSTLADRLLELTGTVAMRDMQAQLLDSNPIERERGITIKLAPVRMHFFCHPGPRAGIHENAVWIPGQARNDSKEEFILNLIDTPGHVDFGYEVSRSLAACEGALLVVDATQGVQAQTLANLHQARLHNLTVIPLINKIDMPHARIVETRAELRALGFRDEEMIEISAKTGQNVPAVLEAIIDRIPPPFGDADKPLRALIFSSQYDPHKGVVVFVRVVDGTMQYDPHTSIKFFASNAQIQAIEAGFFMPQMVKSAGISTGEVGYIATGLKDVRLAKVGDTITAGSTVNAHIQPKQAKEALPGYREPKPMVFLSLFPLNADEFTHARECMEKLRLSDSAFTFRPISSLALGNGFHCGFLGLLHAEIVQERLSREFDLDMIATAPSVEYHLMLARGVSLSKLGLTVSSVINEHPELVRGAGRLDNFETSGEAAPQSGDRTAREIGRATSAPDQGVEVAIQSATEFPDPTYIDGVKEPIMDVKIFTPKRYVGAIMQLSQEKRGEYIDMKYLHGEVTIQQYNNTTIDKAGEVEDEPNEFDSRIMVEMTYLLPLSDMIIDFFDRLKSISEGYASLDYEFFEFQAVDVVKIDILVNKEKVDALSFLAVRDQAHHRSIAIVERLAQVIPRQQFQIPIQGAIGGQIVARADVKAFRKDVIQKLYGGDRTRKDKLLKKQAKGKARMKLIGRVEIPQSAFFEVLKRE
ncbi:MAG TPA: GTP-binding protein [Patescibacteria group bacterium]|nr:GTP-binding protein [Patescibacteria group bacterium]